MHDQKESIFKIKNSNGFKIGQKPSHTSRYTCIKYLRFYKKRIKNKKRSSQATAF